jgi:hypothetical protein
LLQLLVQKLADAWGQDPLEINDILREAGLKMDTPARDVACPNCGGGSSQEAAFVLTLKEDAILWHCHRAKCGFTGGVNVYGGRDGALPPECNVSSGSSSKGPLAAGQERKLRSQQLKLGLHLLEKKKQQVRGGLDLWIQPEEALRQWY